MNLNLNGNMGYIAFRECLVSGNHLKDCDKDGYCNKCGFQEDTFCSTCGEPVFNDEECIGEILTKGQLKNFKNCILKT